jgi:hypothetical protein
MVPLTLEWHYSPYALPLIIATLLNLSLSLVAWSRRAVPGATAFTIMVLAGAEWALAYGLQLGALDVPTQLLFGNLEYFGIVTVPLALFIFSLSYTGRSGWLNPSSLGLLALEPALTLLFVWTMPTHGPIRSGVTLDLGGPYPSLIVSRGPWFWIHTAYSYLLLAFGSAILLDASLRVPRIYRCQIVGSSSRSARRSRATRSTSPT